MRLRGARAGDAAALAQVHARSFADPWSAQALEEMMALPGALTVLAESAPPGGVIGFVMLRAVAGEAEVLTLAVAPERRRGGAASALIGAATAQALAAGAAAVYLEVARDNFPALALYGTKGFVAVGERAGYYARPGGGRTDALVLRLQLTPGA